MNFPDDPLISAMVGAVLLAHIVDEQCEDFERKMSAYGCNCEWDEPAELTDDEFLEEQMKSPSQRYYHLLFAVDPTFNDATGYLYRAIGCHIEHVYECPVGRSICSRDN